MLIACIKWNCIYVCFHGGRGGSIGVVVLVGMDRTAACHTVYYSLLASRKLCIVWYFAKARKSIHV